MDELIAYVSTIFYIKKRRYYFTGTPSSVAAVKPKRYFRRIFRNKQTI
jgi:2-keto-4-pentenoate hydratase/2-oxohepta-3-ene-1,7-dioic acid hydratase in catechol pathway